MTSGINKSNDNCLVKETEAELLKKCRANDRLSQHQLYQLYARKMLTVCSRYSYCLEDAEDILSEGFARVFEKLGSYKASGSFEGWMRRIMVNIAIEKFRKKKPVHTELKDYHISQDAIAADNDVSLQIDGRQLLTLIQQLPPSYQMVFNLYVFEGLKHKEIADQLGISEGTSKSNLSHARAWLKRAIGNLATIQIPHTHE